MSTVILVAGYPGTGKSHFCRWIGENWTGIEFFSPDEIKEKLWDEEGYDDEAGKARLTEKSWEIFYSRLEKEMQGGGDLCLDYPFSDKQKAKLEALVKTYSYTPVTIRLVGDLETLCRRQLARDKDPDRHLGHIMTHYHKGDVLEDRSKADALVDHEEFLARCRNRGYGEFSMGALREVDVTRFEDIPYDELRDFLGAYLSKKPKA